MQQSLALSNLWTLLYVVWILSEVLIAVATRTRHTTGQVRDRGSQLLLWIVIVSSITACEWLRRTSLVDTLHFPDWLKQTGVLVILLGLAIRFTAIVHLGKSFSANVAIRDSQKVHRSGLYRFVRHPSYLGLLLVFLAIGLHSGNWLSLASAFLPPTATLLYRIHIEEAACTMPLAKNTQSTAVKRSACFPASTD